MSARLTHSQFKEVQAALLDAFEDYSDLKIMVRVSLNERLEDITPPAKLPVVISNLVTWAEQRGQIEELVQGAWVENPHNPKLSRLRGKLGRWFLDVMGASTIEILGMSFVSIGGNERRNMDLYLGHTPISEKIWCDVMGEPSVETPRKDVARVNITILDVQRFCRTATDRINPESEPGSNAPRMSIKIPSCDALKAQMEAYDERMLPARDLQRPYLMRAGPNSTGLNDLLGVVYQFCEKGEQGFRVLGGSFKTPESDFERGNIPDRDCHNTVKDSCYGFRPLLEIRS